MGSSEDAKKLNQNLSEGREERMHARREEPLSVSSILKGGNPMGGEGRCFSFPHYSSR